MEGVSVATCKDFNIVVHGFADMHSGMYKIFGMDGRYQMGEIETPNPCYYYTANPFEDVSSSSSSSSDDHGGDYGDDEPMGGCEQRGLGFVENQCDFMCKTEQSEWQGSLESVNYDANSDETTFVYEVKVSDEDGCHEGESAVVLDFFLCSIRL